MAKESGTRRTNQLVDKDKFSQFVKQRTSKRAFGDPVTDAEVGEDTAAPGTPSGKIQAPTGGRGLKGNTGSKLNPKVAPIPEHKKRDSRMSTDERMMAQAQENARANNPASGNVPAEALGQDTPGPVSGLLPSLGVSTGSSLLGEAWGINKDAYDMVMDDPNILLEIWGQQTGNENHSAMRRDDAAAGQDNYMLNLLTGGQPGNAIDYQGSYLDSMNTPGGTYTTINDAVGALSGGQDGLLGETTSGMQAGDQANYINNLIIGSTGAYMPGPVQQAYASLLNNAQTEYAAAVAQGYGGDYMSWLAETGKLQLLTQGGL